MMMQRNLLVREYFAKGASFWKEVYSGTDIAAAIYQKRRDLVLQLVRELGLPAGASVLDVGCGAGTFSIPLARQGFAVTALDCVPEMVALTNRLALESGVSGKVKAGLGDVHQLPAPPHCFEVVLAIGVLPWVERYQPAVQEMSRVLRPGGHLIVTIDNRWGLHRLCDPATNCLAAPLRRALGGVLRRVGSSRAERGVRSTLTSPRQLESLLRNNGFVPQRGWMVGFGPFSFLQRPLTSPALGLLWGERLQRLCDRGVPLLRSMGAQYIALAQKQH